MLLSEAETMQGCRFSFLLIQQRVCLLKIEINAELTHVCGCVDPFAPNDPEMHCDESLKSLLPRRHE